MIEAKEVLDSSLSLLKFASCATIIGEDAIPQFSHQTRSIKCETFCVLDANRIAIGTEEGLFCVNLLKDSELIASLSPALFHSC